MIRSLNDYYMVWDDHLDGDEEAEGEGDDDQEQGEHRDEDGAEAGPVRQVAGHWTGGATHLDLLLYIYRYLLSDFPILRP